MWNSCVSKRFIISINNKKSLKWYACSFCGLCFCHVFLHQIYVYKSNWFFSTLWVDDESQLKEDELLARALQESLNVELQNGTRNGNESGSGGLGNGNVNGNRIGNGNGNVIGNRIGNGIGNFYQPIPFPYSTGFRYKCLLPGLNFLPYVFFNLF